MRMSVEREAPVRGALPHQGDLEHCARQQKEYAAHVAAAKCSCSRHPYFRIDAKAGWVPTGPGAIWCRVEADGVLLRQQNIEGYRYHHQMKLN